MRKVRASLLGVLLLVSSLISGCTGGLTAAWQPTATYPPLPTASATPSPQASIPWAPWPTQGWATATPEQVGMDSDHLLTLMDFLGTQDLNLHSLLIIRRGYLVFELNLYPHTTDTKQDVQSITKGVTSALVGIALQKKTIQSLDSRVVDYFAGIKIANLDERKRAMTLHNLLTMTSGMNWPEMKISYASRDNPMRAMWYSGDPVQYVLDRPMETDPGTRFSYNTGSTQLLAAILEQTSGQKLSDLANQELFNPLGILKYSWHRMYGIDPGGSGLALTPRDMAKLGYLYLRGGLWGDRQIVPADWVAESTHKQVQTGSGGGYGYLWWLDPDGGYSQVGFGGQSIEVFPDKDLVVVITGALGAAEKTSLHNLVDYFVLPAVVSDNPLPASPSADELTTRLQAAAQQPKPKPVDPLPALAAQLNGHTYSLGANSLNWKSIQFNFSSTSEAKLAVTLNNGTSVTVPVGLDGVPRVGTSWHTSVVGEWENEHTFTLSYELIGDADGWTIRMDFSGSTVDLTLTSYVQADVSHVKGTHLP